MIEKITLDMLTQDSVSVKKQQNAIFSVWADAPTIDESIAKLDINMT